MASSLDDMEAYELLQLELDRSLKSYIHTLALGKQEHASTLHFLNHWIEYICFVRHLSVWEEIIAKETQKAFWDWYCDLAKETPIEKEAFDKTLEDFMHYSS
jgi:hypothetical protein